jgi:hypothetical protein
MPWRSLLHYLSNNEELVRRLSESYPIRRAAQLTAYFFNVSKDKFIEQRGKYERAGGWNKTKTDVKDDFKGVQGVGKVLIQIHGQIIKNFVDNKKKVDHHLRLHRQQQKRKNPLHK